MKSNQNQHGLKENKKKIKKMIEWKWKLTPPTPTLKAIGMKLLQ